MIAARAVALALAITALAPGVARAEPRFAAQTGLACAACHVDPAGGGLETDWGLAWARSELATTIPKGSWDPRISAIARIGAGLRVDDELTAPVATSLDDVPFEAKGHNAFALSQASLRLQVAPIPGRVDLVVDEDLAATRLTTAFAMVRGPSQSWAKAGWLAQRWGLGERPGTTFTQEAAGQSANPEGAGLAAGAANGPWSAAVALTSGLAPEGRVFVGRRLAAIAEFRTPVAWAGISAAVDDVADARFPVANRSGALHAGFSRGPLVALAEFDLSRAHTDVEASLRAASYFEVDLRAHPGVYLQATYESYDPLLEVAENARDRTTLGATWYAVPHVAVEARLIVRRDIPQLPDGNADSALIAIRGSL